MCRFEVCILRTMCMHPSGRAKAYSHVLHPWQQFTQRVPSSSFSSSDISIWVNAVRQLLVENPQQSLAVTTWECSSEGRALHCNYKHRKSRDWDATIQLPRQCWKYSVVFFFFNGGNVWDFFPKQLKGFKRRPARATFWSRSQKTAAVLCHSHSIIAVNISEGRRYWRDLMEAVKTVMTGTVKEESNVVILQMP